jgi:hypothetical protein
MSTAQPCPAGSYDRRSSYQFEPDFTGVATSTGCWGSCRGASFLYKTGQYELPCQLSAVGIVFIFCMALLVASLLVVFILRRRRAARRARVAAQAAAVELSQSVSRLRADVSARLARDAVQSAMASPIHAALVAQLSQQGQTRTVMERYTQLVQTAITRALVECELNGKCRLLSMLALNPDVLLSPSLHVFCRSAVITAATDGLEQFVHSVTSMEGDGMEGSSSPAFYSLTGQSSAAADAASAAAQRECAQFASAWLSSTVTSLRVPLKRPPPVRDLHRDAGGAWLFAVAVPAQATVVDLPADGGYASAGEGAGSSAGMFLHPFPSPSAPLPPLSYSAAVSFNGGSSAFSPSGLFQAQLLPNQCPSFATEMEGAAAPSPSHIVFMAPSGAAAEGEGIELQSPPGGARPFNDV